MAIIKYQVGMTSGVINWIADESFDELWNKEFNLGNTKAVDIKNYSLSTLSKILLSAVAGATIQHLLDAGMDSNQIFSEGRIRIVKGEK